MYVTTNLKGLTHREAEDNIQVYGKNLIPEKNDNNIVILFLKQFLSPFIYILLTVAVISLFAKSYTDSVVIMIVLCINAVVGTYQEYKANNAIKALKKLTHAKSRVVREGELITIKTEDVTVRDIVYLESGDIMPADGRVVESHQLTVNESQLTGESIPITKENTAELYKSSIIVSGSGYMSVTKVGDATFIGTIAKDISSNSDKRSELDKKIAHFSSRLLFMLLCVIVLFVAASLNTGIALKDALKVGVALSVAVVPEGLPIVLTVVLSLGALHISRARALLRNLHSGSTLASVSYICTDKTGTLTHGDLSVKEVVPLDHSFSQEMINEYLYHSLDLKSVNGKKIGDVLELSLDSYLQRTFSFNEIKESPFTSEKKYNAKEYQVNGEYLQLYKGAPEVLGVKDEHINAYVSEGFRVIAIGYKKHTVSEEFSTTEVLPLALVVFEDKIRSQAKTSILGCKKAGISVIMITGDNILTAEHVAREVGIVSDEKDILITGQELDTLSDEALIEKIHYIKVIARANPLHKERVVKALQEKGEVVAMTGDGVNDGPALSLANIGISMGRTGTEVAKEASDLVLIDDDFSDIALAIFEARTISENIRKTLTFLMTAAASIVIAVLGSVFLSLPLPFLAVQILWLNFVMAGFLDFSIATEKSESVYRNYTYHRYRGSLLNAYDIVRISVLSLYVGGITLVMFYIFLQVFTLDAARTGIMFLISAFIWCNALNVRKNYDTIFSFNPFTNVYVVFGITLEFFILLGSIYFDTGNTLFTTVKLPYQLLVALFFLATSIFIVDACFKLGKRGLRKVFRLIPVS